MHQVLLTVSIMCLVILLLMFILRRFNQPYLVANIIAGITPGPHVTGVFSSVYSSPFNRNINRLICGFVVKVHWLAWSVVIFTTKFLVVLHSKNSIYLRRDKPAPKVTKQFSLCLPCRRPGMSCIQVISIET